MTDRKDIPLHQAYAIANGGLQLRKFTTGEHSHEPKDYVHRDDYYMFGIVDSGHVRAEVDFEEIELAAGSALFLVPGQIHRFISADNLHAMVLFADSRHISQNLRQIFDEAVVLGLKATLSHETQADLKQLYLMLERYIESGNVASGLAQAFIGLIADSIVPCTGTSVTYNQRHLELFLKFKQNLHDNMRISHSPAYYADRLNISPVYLNEVVNHIAGCSTESYIRRSIILEARRMLAYSGLSVKEIAFVLGFDDSSYFSRIFRQSAGITPSEFRKKP